MANSTKIRSSYYPFLPFRIKFRGLNLEGEALVDTGFSGYLAMPPSALNGNLGLPDSRTSWKLADNNVVDAPLYFGLIEIIGLPPMHGGIILMSDEYILGRGILDRLKITFDHGREIIAEL